MSYSLTKHFIQDAVPRLEDKLDVAFTQDFARSLRNFGNVPQTILFRNKYKCKDVVICKIDGNYLVVCVNPVTKMLITIFSPKMYLETTMDCEIKYNRNKAIVDDFMKMTETV